MSESVREEDAASGVAQVPETGDVRVSTEGRVEHYDGSAWRLYEELPDDYHGSPGPRFREGNGPGPGPASS
ncbi:hypothetical protein AB0G32_21025 [Streptomyces sp. NPDC023723]|uniref:hypothetical protein n=1 Tax=Streptomyces sp. NPDC023723 TaxID=3154323 RepID=UPI0033CB118C